MEAGTAPTTTGSATIADLLPRAARLYADRVAVQHRAGDGWSTVTYAEAGELVSELGRGLIDLGLEPGDRACILSGTRPDWTYADFAISAAGGVVVPIHQTNSPEEVGYILEDSGARLIVCEDAEQVDKVVRVRGSAPGLRTIVIVEGEHEAAVGWAELRERGRARDAGDLDARTAAVGPDDPYTIVSTSGTTGPPKGCVLHHCNYRSVLDMCLQPGVLGGGSRRTSRALYG